MSEQDLARVAEIVGSVLSVDERDPVKLTKASLPEWDSLSQIEIIFSVEEEFGVSLDPDRLGELDSAESILDAVTAAR